MAYPVIPDIPVQSGSYFATLQNAAAANGNGTAMSLLGSASVIFTVTMTGFTGTLTFQTTEDNSNWDPLWVQQEGTNLITTFLVGSTTTSVHVYEGSTAGLQQVRAVVSNRSAGSVTVTAHAIATPDAPRTLNANIVPQTPLIAQKANGVSTGNVASIAAVFPTNNTAGNSIVVVCANGNNGTLTVADTQANTYTSAISVANSTTFETQIFYAVNIGGGANTVTVTNGGSAASMAVEIYEVSSFLMQVAGQPDQTSSGTGTGTTASTSAIAPSAPNSLAFLGVGIGTAAQNITVTAGTTWTADAGTNGLVPTTPSGLFQFNSFSQYLGTLTPVVPKATIGSSEPYAAVAAIFRPVTVGVQGTVSIGGYNYTHISSATTVLVKTGAGILHAIVVNTGVASATIEFDDALTHTSPVIGIITCQASTVGNPVTAIYDVAFLTGLSITTSGATDVTVVWK